MPLIQPPNYTEEPIEQPKSTIRPKEWYDWFLNVPNWKCSCGLTNFGRNKHCADLRCALPRPENYDGESKEWQS